MPKKEIKKDEKKETKEEVVDEVKEAKEVVEEEVVDELVGKSIGGKQIISVEEKDGKKIATDESGATYPLSPDDVEEYILAPERKAKRG